VPPEDFEPNFRPFSYDFENNFQEEVALTQQTSGSAIDINLIKLQMHWIQLVRTIKYAVVRSITSWMVRVRLCVCFLVFLKFLTMIRDLSVYSRTQSSVKIYKSGMHKNQPNSWPVGF
jgi:hypothetical protein